MQDSLKDCGIDLKTIKMAASDANDAANVAVEVADADLADKTSNIFLVHVTELGAEKFYFKKKTFWQRACNWMTRLFNKNAPTLDEISANSLVELEKRIPKRTYTPAQDRPPMFKVIKIFSEQIQRVIEEKPKITALDAAAAQANQELLKNLAQIISKAQSAYKAPSGPEITTPGATPRATLRIGPPSAPIGIGGGVGVPSVSPPVLGVPPGVPPGVVLAPGPGPVPVPTPAPSPAPVVAPLPTMTQADMAAQSKKLMEIAVTFAVAASPVAKAQQILDQLIQLRQTLFPAGFATAKELPKETDGLINFTVRNALNELLTGIDAVEKNARTIRSQIVASKDQMDLLPSAQNVLKESRTLGAIIEEIAKVIPQIIDLSSDKPRLSDGTQNVVAKANETISIAQRAVIEAGAIREPFDVRFTRHMQEFLPSLDATENALKAGITNNNLPQTINDITQMLAAFEAATDTIDLEEELNKKRQEESRNSLGASVRYIIGREGTVDISTQKDELKQCKRIVQRLVNSVTTALNTVTSITANTVASRVTSNSREQIDVAKKDADQLVACLQSFSMMPRPKDIHFDGAAIKRMNDLACETQKAASDAQKKIAEAAPKKEEKPVEVSVGVKREAPPPDAKSISADRPASAAPSPSELVVSTAATFASLTPAQKSSLTKLTIPGGILSAGQITSLLRECTNLTSLSLIGRVDDDLLTSIAQNQNITQLTINPGTKYEAQSKFTAKGLNDLFGMKGLKSLEMYIPPTCIGTVIPPGSQIETLLMYTNQFCDAKFLFGFLKNLTNCKNLQNFGIRCAKVGYLTKILFFGEIPKGSGEIIGGVIAGLINFAPHVKNVYLLSEATIDKKAEDRPLPRSHELLKKYDVAKGLITKYKSQIPSDLGIDVDNLLTHADTGLAEFFARMRLNDHDENIEEPTRINVPAHQEWLAECDVDFLKSVNELLKQKGLPPHFDEAVLKQLDQLIKQKNDLKPKGDDAPIFTAINQLLEKEWHKPRSENDLTIRTQFSQNPHDIPFLRRPA